MTDQTITDRHTRAIHLMTQMEGYEGSEAAKSRTQAWNYYLQRPRGDEVQGRSPVVTGDVSAMVESNLAQVAEAISTDNLAEFEATGADDEPQAKLEGDTVSRLLMKGPGWLRIATAIKNALLLRMGIASPSVDTIEEREVVNLQDVDVVARAVLEEQGAKFLEYDGELKTGSIERTTTRQVLNVRNVNPENFLYVRWPLDDFDNIPACAERHITTRQQLISDEEISAEKVDAIPQTPNLQKSDEAVHALKAYINEVRAVSVRQQYIEWYALFYMHNGTRYRAVVAGGKVLKEKVVSKRPPYAIGIPFINPGHVDGFSVFDKLKGTQDITTALTRMLNDNANAVTMNRLAVIQGACDDTQLTDQDPSGILQFLKSKVGGDIRNGVMPLQTQDLTGGLVTSLQYQRQVRSEMAGASLDVGTGQVQLPDRMGSMGLDRAYSASEQLAALVLKTFGETLIRDLWLMAHDLLRTQWNGPVEVKISGRWQTMRPAEWQRRYGVQIKPGMSPGERQRRSNALGAMIGFQMQLADRGMEGVLVDAERFYRNVCDWARLNDIPTPEQYLIDPTSEGAKQTLMSKAQQAQAAQAAQQRLQEMALALEQMEKAVTKYGIDVKAAVEKYRIDSENERKEAELTTDLVKTREAADRELVRKVAEGEKGKADAGE